MEPPPSPVLESAALLPPPKIEPPDATDVPPPNGVAEAVLPLPPPKGEETVAAPELLLPKGSAALPLLPKGEAIEVVPPPKTDVPVEGLLLLNIEPVEAAVVANVAVELPPNIDPDAAAPPKIVDELVLVTAAVTATNGDVAIPPNGEALEAVPPPPPNILVPPPVLKALVVEDDPPNTLAWVAEIVVDDDPPKLLPVAAGLLTVFPPNIPDLELDTNPPKIDELCDDWVNAIVVFVMDDCPKAEVTLADVGLLKIPLVVSVIILGFIVSVEGAFEELVKIPEVGVTLVDDAAGSEETIEAKAEIEPLLASEDVEITTVELGLEKLVLPEILEDPGLLPNIPCDEDKAVAELETLAVDPPPNIDFAVPVA